MRLYLVQHGEAKRKEEDPARPLTDSGREEVERVASYAAKIGVKVERILHSGKLRAQQTAEIMAKHLKPPKGVEKTDELEPLADPKVWAERLKKVEENLMLVGHLPHLSRLTSLLLTDREDVEPIAFRMGGIVCLEKDERGKWRVQWIIRPETLP